MDDNLKQIKQELKEYKNTIVLIFDKLFVLRDYSEDKYDYYYTLQDINVKFE